MPLPQARPLRSILWVPGNRERWMRNAPSFGPDGLILDLEDSVPPHEKTVARRLVGKVTGQLAAAGLAVFVRVNGLASGLTEEDLAAVVRPGLYGILLPKVSGPEDIVAADGWLRRHEQRAGLPVPSLAIMPGLETARAIRQTYEIGQASERVVHLGLGHMAGGDTARSLGFQWTRQGKETFYARSRVLLEARAAGDPYPCAGPWSEIRDLDGLRAYLVEMRQLGYTGASVLHPDHVPVCNEVFTPTPEEIARWRGVLAAMEAAERQGRAAVVHEGQMVDIAMQKTARDMLELARRLGAG